MLNTRPIAAAENEFTNQRLAVLIDADNAQAVVIENLLAEVARYGKATVKRIYGDFTTQQSASWKETLNKHAISPIQQFAYTTGKNATDSRLIIDAMDLLHRGNMDGFCIVSSDSDFTSLANRIREEGLAVYGFGEKKTPEAFRKACDLFVFTENLRPLPKSKASAPPQKSRAKTLKEKPDAAPKDAKSKQDKGKETIQVDFLKEAIAMTSDDDGWAPLGKLGQYIRKVIPDFDPRTYGFRSMTELFAALADSFDLQDRALAQSPTKIIYVRTKE